MWHQLEGDANRDRIMHSRLAWETEGSRSLKRHALINSLSILHVCVTLGTGKDLENKNAQKAVWRDAYGEMHLEGCTWRLHLEGQVRRSAFGGMNSEGGIWRDTSTLSVEENMKKALGESLSLAVLDGLFVRDRAWNPLDLWVR